MLGILKHVALTLIWEESRYLNYSINFRRASPDSGGETRTWATRRHLETWLGGLDLVVCCRWGRSKIPYRVQEFLNICALFYFKLQGKWILHIGIYFSYVKATFMTVNFVFGAGVCAYPSVVLFWRKHCDIPGYSLFYRALKCHLQIPECVFS